jgi:hypothetical protein
VHANQAIYVLRTVINDDKFAHCYTQPGALMIILITRAKYYCPLFNQYSVIIS